MPPALGNKNKGKGREARRSGSRNTTPSSGLTAIAAPTISIGYLDTDISQLLIPTATQYSEVLEKLSGSGQIPDVKTLESLTETLNTLGELADTRGNVCNGVIRELSQKRKELEREMIEREAGERLKVKVEMEDVEGMYASKGGKLKKKKDKTSREERPLAHGAHALTRQDGSDVPQKRKDTSDAASPPAKKLKNLPSGDSSLSSPSATSPLAAESADQQSAAGSLDSDSSDSRQPEPAQEVPQYYVFGPNPLTFPDPTIYHIREVTPNMTDEEKKEIYGVASFPKDDLLHMMPGTPPDKDFSNSKPANQVSANTFASYIEPYVRPLTEEDINFLKEKGDRTTPFLLPRRGKKHYTEIWAEEDGAINVDSSTQAQERLPLNQGRGNVEQITDEVAETDQVSVGPLLSRLYSLLRFEHRTLPDEAPAAPSGPSTNDDSAANGNVNGDSTAMEIDQTNGETEPAKPLNSATTFPDASPSSFKVPAAKLDHAQLDERLKAELRYIGFLGQDDNPDYDAHYDDDIAERLRLLQAELKKQMIINGARKARLLEIARERLAYQEYMTIHDDLDSQVQQAYLKRTRTLGKSKKGSQTKYRPGGAGGGSHPVSSSTIGVSRPGIGDLARTLMDRRKRWAECIGPVFKDCKTTVPGKDETIFDPVVMAEYEKAELEGWDEEQG
ncbi:hypothetical protein VTO42DRAFT_902 [Malbranchea cinnamomea]